MDVCTPTAHEIVELIGLAFTGTTGPSLINQL
jgi:hypothetical protein